MKQEKNRHGINVRIVLNSVSPYIAGKLNQLNSAEHGNLLIILTECISTLMSVPFYLAQSEKDDNAHK